MTRSPFTFAISGDSLFIIKGGAENISKAVNKALAKAVPSQKSEITNPDTEQSPDGRRRRIAEKDKPVEPK